MNMTTVKLKPLHSIMAQYAERCDAASKADKAYCWCHNVWSYGKWIEADYATLAELAARANRLAVRIADARGEYKTHLQDQQDVILYNLHMMANNPEPVNCGIEWFIN